MKVFYKRRFLIFGAIILLFIPIVNIYAVENDEHQKNVEVSGVNNLLATIEITHYRIFEKDVIMDIEITPADNREYNFTEIDGIVEMNFTIIFNHRLYTNNIIMRETLLGIRVKDSEAVYLDDYEFFPCNSTETLTDYFYVDKVNKACYTNGTNQTLRVEIFIKASFGQIFYFPPGNPSFSFPLWYGAVNYDFPFKWLNPILYINDSEFDIKIIPIPV